MENFIRNEYEWIYESCNDAMDILFDDLDVEDLNMDEINENLSDFIDAAVERICDDEYIIQSLHDWMHDELINVIKESLDIE